MKLRFSSSGIHLFNRQTGWNVLVDDIRPPEHSWALAPRHVSIALTNACDLRCSYCFAPKTPATLNFEHIISWLAELDSHGTLGVGFGGGEPTLYPHFAELCVHAASRTSLAVTFTTHGHNLTDKLLSALAGHVNFIRVSMDGVRNTYERLRHRSFPSLLKRFSAIREIVRFGINYVVNTDTIEDLDSAIRVATDAGASEFLLLPERSVNGSAGASEEVLQRLRSWVRSYPGSVPLSISAASSDGMPITNPFVNESGLAAYAHVDANGTLKRSSFDPSGIRITSLGVMSALRELRDYTKKS